MGTGAAVYDLMETGMGGSGLSVEMLGRSFGRVVLPDVSMEVSWLRWEAIGGPASGALRLGGSGKADCLDWLRRPVYVRTVGGEAVWWGFVWSVRVPLGGYVVGKSLEGVANRVRVRYTDTTGAEAVTGWADNSASQAELGVIEYEEQMAQEEATSTEAEQRRARILGDRAWPTPTLERWGVDGGYGEIMLRGWWQTLTWQYWTQAGTGGVENTTQVASIVSAEGAFLTGTDVVNSSGVSGEQERDGTQTALENIAELLATGTTNGRRLLATVTRERILRVWEEPARSAAAEYNLHGGNRMSQGRVQAALLPGVGPVGVWAALVDLPVGLAQGELVAQLSPVFVEANEWSDGKLRPEARDIQSAWERLG